ncbi:tripartite tricarboxylate transporter substrate binding protein [uncultured Sphaerochaeta sp.]|uniref:Bug family tripartite tricarboxylate transporter substrate binding protein n=1 Tax=uncultured Sphaerochaeta sp. TaxID=886478 RepID=UPI002A0A19AD|nr:tripartite tricarboxylate transporter substrate binding protein [uncultured Sphaerochaeta sp.]
MKHKMLVFLLLLLSISMLWGAGTTESGDASYPNKPITMIVPYGAGGTTDISGRQLAVQLEKHLGVSITVINQGGASGSIGARTVLDAKSDGYTVLFTAESLGTQRVMGLSEMSYDDFTPIMVAVNDPKVIVVGKDSKYETLQDLVDDIKNRPGKVKMSYTGPGGSGHVQAMIYGKFGMEMALTAYPGGADCILAVLGDQVDFTNSNYSTVTGYLESGDLKLLGISALDRLEAHSDVPTLGEILPGSERYLSNPFTPLSFLVDKDVPSDVVTILRDAAKKAVQEPAWKAFVAKNSLDKLYEKYPDEASMKEFYKDWESLVSWMLYDSGVAKFSPEKFGIEKSQY